METPSDVDWVQLRIDMGSVDEEDFKTKFKRKIFGNPLVPIGAAATSIALITGLAYLRVGNSAMQQIMMRSRVSAQGFTIAVALLGTMSSTLSSHFEEATNFAKKYTGIGTVSDDNPGQPKVSQVESKKDDKKNDK
ncbi:GSCOCG00007966001-RA-CDS [Cotesia congregata]|nr:GSCOCG00007966001-RA-CDS [Cotesia congregata]